MLFLSVVNHYMLWHYSLAFKEIFHVWSNFIWFTIHFFSIPQLVKSWLSPWKRIVEERGKKWDLEDFAGYIVIGFFSRLIGFILRSIVITIGLICLTVVIFGGIITYFFWLFAPFFIIGLLGIGITILIT